MQIHAFRKLLSYVHKDSKSLLTKTILVMKLSAILILVTSLHVAARSSAQKVTYSGKAVELPQVLSIIREQTGYVFFYERKDLEGLDPVTVSVKDASIESALKTILHGLPLDFEVQGNTIFINKKVPVVIHMPLAPESPDAAGDTLRGYIRDSTGEPLSGASVIIKGTKTGARTNIRGEFLLNQVKTGTILVISYTGYVDQEVSTSGSNYLYLTMRRSQDILDAPVIQAYGTTSRRFSVGSISTVTAETIEKQPVTNVLLALQGQAPGLAINAQSGMPGSRVLVQVRGQNTLLNDPGGFKPYDQPLLIVDGVPFATQNANVTQLSSLATANSFSGGISTSGGLSTFNNINPADIESVTILKDADATSIYGTQGSNGVILITTKKGKAGKTTFNFSTNTGVNTRARNVTMMNTPQYLQMRKDAIAADGATPQTTSTYGLGYAPDLTLFDQSRYTDWQKLVFGKGSTSTDVHASLSGGSYNNTFLASVGYTHAGFNYPGDFSDQRFSLHTTFHHSSTDNRLTLDFGSDYGYDKNLSAAFGGASTAFSPPNLPALKDASGTLQWAYKGFNLSQFQIYSGLLRTTQSQNYNLNQTLRVGYRILSGLSFTVNLGYNKNTTTEHSISPAAAQNPAYAVPSAYFAGNNAEAINVEPQLDYTVHLGKGMLSALLGGTYKKTSSYATDTYAGGYASDVFLGSVNGASYNSTSDITSIYRYSAGFARLKYIYDSKYIVSLTGRRDGSSNFGPGNQFGNFGSAGLGWIFSEEKAFKKMVPFISYAKLSGSYGTNGSDGVGAYQYQAFWRPSSSNVPAFQGVKPDQPVNLYNPNYSWALKKMLNLSLDLGFLHDRILANVTYYRSREGNQLGGYPLPIQVGFVSVTQNLPGTVQNKGWEISVTSTNVKTTNFSWSTSFNISFNRNKLLSFPNLNGSPYRSKYVIGQPVSVIYGYRFKGLNDTTGLFEYYRGKGGVSTYPSSALAQDGGDKYVIGNREVKFMGGFGNTLNYKQFSLTMFFQFSSQTAPNYLANLYSGIIPGSGLQNEPVEALNYWKKPGDHTPLMRLSSSPYVSNSAGSAGSFSASDGAYTDDTYLRLKTLSVSYSLPAKVVKKLHMQDVRIYGSSQNLLTITNYKVGDPEQFGFSGFPLQRTTVIGLNLNF